MVVSRFLLALLTAGLCNAASVYNLVPRSASTVRSLEDGSPSAAPLLPSFDGNLAAVKELALLKASRSSAPVSFSCDKEETVDLEVLNWKYKIETVPGADVPTVFGDVQETVLEQVGPLTLSCLNQGAASAHIVAMDTAIPSDQQSTETCVPDIDPVNNCTVVIGRMRVFLSRGDTGTVDEATALVLKNIQQAFAETDFVERVGSGLIKITYIADNSASGNSIKDETGNSDSGQGSVSTMGMTMTSLLFVSVSSAALVVFVGSVYLYRRVKRDDQDGAATQLAGSTLNGTYEPSRQPTSPYSEMVSASYRLDRLGEMSILSSTNMSPVYEQDHEDTDTAAGSVVLSEGGYTTDAGCTDGGDSTTLGGSKYSCQSTPMNLGARPFPGAIVGDMDMEEISDSDLDTSGEMSPVKMYVGGKLLVPDGSDQEDESFHADEALLFSPRTDNEGSDVESVNEDFFLPSPSP